MTRPIHQLRASIFNKARFRRFEDRTYAHLKAYFPRHCQILGERQIRSVIRDGWKKANQHGLTQERCTRAYIDFMFLLGSGFSTDLLLPWATKILNDKAITDQVTRMDRLYDRVWTYIGHIAFDYRDAKGEPITARFVEEIRQLRRESNAKLKRANFPRFSHALERRLKRVFPAKYKHVGQTRVRKLISRARTRAKKYGITSERGVVIFTAQMFVLGGGFDRDLLLPWISKVLTNPKIPNQDQRVDQLLSVSVKGLRTWWDSAGSRKE